MTEKSEEYVYNYTKLTSEIVAAYVSNSPIPAPDLPTLIWNVHNAVFRLLSGNTSSIAVLTVEAERPTPAQIRKSVRHDSLVSFIDGKLYKTLKRHLTAHGLHPQSYREQYGLPPDYPMVAQSYAAQRSAIAKEIGLGRPGVIAEDARKGRRSKIA